MEIRRALASDASGVATVHVRSWQATHKGLLPADFLDPLDVEARKVVWQQTIAEADWPRSGTLVAVEANAHIIGFADVGHSRDADAGEHTGELAALYLLPTVWGTGVGRRLMAAALNVLRDAGYADAILWVIDSNERARRFCEAGGWHVDGATKDVAIAQTPLAEVRYRLGL